MVKKQHKSKYITRSMITSNKPSSVSPRKRTNVNRHQLLKKLKDIGINVPSGLSIDILRDLVANNNHALSTSSHIDEEGSESHAFGSHPQFKVDFDSQDADADMDLDNQPVMKALPRRYSLFNCQAIDSSDSLPPTEYIPPSLRKAIQEGKDVSLAHLLIPPEHAAAEYKDNLKEFTSLYLKPSDPRLHRSLSLPDFILAFIRYMNVMTEVHPERRVELTNYLSFVVKLAVQFPSPLFYEYHKNFSRKAASILFSQGRKIDWSVRDDDLYFQIFAGRRARTCDKCSSVDHSTDFCPSILHADLKTDIFNSSTEARSRPSNWSRVKRVPVLTSDNREVCFNFNGYRGCSNSACPRAHLCLKCLQPHSQKDCRPSSLPRPVQA